MRPEQKPAKPSGLLLTPDFWSIRPSGLLASFELFAHQLLGDPGDDIGHQLTVGQTGDHALDHLVDQRLVHAWRRGRPGPWIERLGPLGAALFGREQRREGVGKRGWRGDRRYLPLQDDISSVAYWYQTLPTAPFPSFPLRVR